MATLNFQDLKAQDIKNYQNHFDTRKKKEKQSPGVKRFDIMDKFFVNKQVSNAVRPLSFDVKSLDEIDNFDQSIIFKNQEKIRIQNQNINNRKMNKSFQMIFKSSHQMESNKFDQDSMVIDGIQPIAKSNIREIQSKLIRIVLIDDFSYQNYEQCEIIIDHDRYLKYLNPSFLNPEFLKYIQQLMRMLIAKGFNFETNDNSKQHGEWKQTNEQQIVKFIQFQFQRKIKSLISNLEIESAYNLIQTLILPSSSFRNLVMEQMKQEVQQQFAKKKLIAKNDNILLYQWKKIINDVILIDYDCNILFAVTDRKFKDCDEIDQQLQKVYDIASKMQKQENISLQIDKNRIVETLHQNIQFDNTQNFINKFNIWKISKRNIQLPTILQNQQQTNDKPINIHKNYIQQVEVSKGFESFNQINQKCVGSKILIRPNHYFQRKCEFFLTPHDIQEISNQYIQLQKQCKYSWIIQHGSIRNYLNWLSLNLDSNTLNETLINNVLNGIEFNFFMSETKFYAEKSEKFRQTLLKFFGVQFNHINQGNSEIAYISYQDFLQIYKFTNGLLDKIQYQKFIVTLLKAYFKMSKTILINEFALFLKEAIDSTYNDQQNINMLMQILMKKMSLKNIFNAKIIDFEKLCNYILINEFDYIHLINWIFYH